MSNSSIKQKVADEESKFTTDQVNEMIDNAVSKERNELLAKIVLELNSDGHSLLICKGFDINEKGIKEYCTEFYYDCLPLENTYYLDPETGCVEPGMVYNCWECGDFEESYCSKHCQGQFYLDKEENKVLCKSHCNDEKELNSKRFIEIVAEKNF